MATSGKQFAENSFQPFARHAFAHTVDDDLLPAEGYVAEFNRTNAFVLLNHWMHLARIMKF